MKTTRFFYTLVLAAMTAGAITLTSCSSENEELNKYRQPQPEPVEKTLMEQLISVKFFPTHGHRIVIDGDTPVTVTYDVVPWQLAPLIAENKDMLSLTGIEAPATLTITDVKGNEFGDLDLTLAPSGFEPGKEYRVALVVKDDKISYTTDFTEINVMENVSVNPEGRHQDQAEAREECL